MTALFWISIAFYALGFLFFFMNLETQKEKFLRWGNTIFLAGLGFHFTRMVLAWLIRSEALPHLSEQGITFAILLISWILEKRLRVRFLLLFSIPVALSLSFAGILHAKPVSAVSNQEAQIWFWTHFLTTAGGLGCLLTAVSAALMYLAQSAALKSKHPRFEFLQLPSLDTLDRLHSRTLSLGVLLFSLGILSGIFWAKAKMELNKLSQDPTVILSFMTVGLYVAVLALRLSSLRRGQKIAAGTVLVFAFFLLTWAASVFCPALGLHRGV